MEVDNCPKGKNSLHSLRAKVSLFFLFFQTESAYAAQAGCKLKSTQVSLPSAEILGTDHSTQSKVINTFYYHSSLQHTALASIHLKGRDLISPVENTLLYYYCCYCCVLGTQKGATCATAWLWSQKTS